MVEEMSGPRTVDVVPAVVVLPEPKKKQQERNCGQCPTRPVLQRGMITYSTEHQFMACLGCRFPGKVAQIFSTQNA